MKNGMQLTKRVGFEDIKLVLALTLIMLVLILSACGQESSQNEVSVSGDTLSAPLPSALLTVDETNLVVAVVVDGGAPQTCTNLSVDQVNGTYSCNITLPGGSHTISLVFSIIDATYGTVQVATASGLDVDVIPGQTASADFSTVTLTYVDSDGDGINNLDEIIIGTDPLVADINDNPTIESTIADQNLAEDFTSYTIDLNAAFADVETLDTNLTYGVSGNSSIGVSITNGIATITNTADWNGSETLTFSATDAGGLSISQDVLFTVSAVADILDDAVAVVEDTATIINVLANDSFEGAATVTTTSVPANGSVVVNGDNTITYTPDVNYTGADSFTYTVTSSGVTETATVNLTVSAQDQDILIVHATEPLAYFGWYRSSQMTDPGWDLYQRAIDWAGGGLAPADTDVILFTYDGSLDPSLDEDGAAVYDYLILAGYNVAEVHHQSAIEALPTSYYANFDLALYTNTYPRDATNIVSSGIPFISVSSGQTDEMGIGSGASTMHLFTDEFYVVNSSHYITQPYPLGQLTFIDPMWTDASEATGNGIALVSKQASQPLGSPTGIWEGTLTENGGISLPVVVIVQGGQITLISEQDGTASIGTISVTGADFTATTRLYSLSPTGVTSSMTGTFTAGSAMSGSYTSSDGTSGSFSLSYSPLTDKGSSLGTVAGTWGGGLFLADMTIDNVGVVTGTIPCNYQGTVNIIDPAVNIYGISITTEPFCSGLEGVYNGFAFVSDALSSDDALNVILANENFLVVDHLFRF